ncbi:uncharacterized protein F4822DRAFT_442009 [Hypoxylon trugodes]|uniref:uncharacterized protein n=1 Tax=Hypoxylon trugodes TaxID=326681 RepID=UPI00219DBDDC|nr:uncharacterized protein F4822DRAFT_442009 [Hypoxylon trugodes]KAI1390724.1 hypothetical protein F4822DRAFT_442009 [Hypoxylon trugodes]
MFAQEILDQHDEDKIHPRFHRGELRLSRLNFLSRFTQWPFFTSYIRGRQNYSSLLRDNVSSLATATVFVALVLTAMQVALATDQLKENSQFIAASYGLSVFSILAPLFVLVMVILEVLYNLVKDNFLSKATTDDTPASETPPGEATARTSRSGDNNV